MNDRKDVSYIVYESMATRLERIIERMYLIIILLIVLLVGSNCAWIYYECQFEDISTVIEAEQDATDGGSNYVVNGDYGKTEDKDNN
jgi:hypothetical protein